MAVRAEKMAEIAELERELGGADYPLEAALACVNRMGEMLRDGTRNQQKRAINLMLDKILVGTDSRIKGVKLQDWAQPLFADLLMVSGDTACQGVTYQKPVTAPSLGGATLDSGYSIAQISGRSKPMEMIRLVVQGKDAL